MAWQSTRPETWYWLATRFRTPRTRGWVRKLDPGGNVLWNDPLAVDAAVEIAVGTDDRIVAACVEYGDFGYGSFCLRIYGADGTLEEMDEQNWNMVGATAMHPTGLTLAGSADRLYAYDQGQHAFWEPSPDHHIHAMAMAASGGLALAGRDGSGPNESWIAWLDDASTDDPPQWSIAGPSGHADGVAVDGAGCVIATGSQAGSSPSDPWVLKLAPDGTEQWTASVDLGPREATPTAVAVDSRDRIVVVGYLGPYSGSPDPFVAKYSPNGDALWSVAQTDGIASSVAIDAEDRIVVAGRIASEGWLATYSP